ncbi:hypothetical protein UNDYM_1918 [Undibacterium sp. YM2]|uniref:hypothetical protein n=1 Tax=Undibacterium sp. YM2 TaxID=2058625 RepID=UPI001331DE96|nr:hypothetical protein [Undibacterium sp. YM2]BBB66171.1 hypothetical protein UNDYM_1918 [Undibacterium sp. YM2]
MRSFSALEKKLITRMIELDENVGALNVLANIFNSTDESLRFPEHLYVALKAENDVSIYIKQDVLNESGLNWLNEVEGKISRTLLRCVALLEYLEGERLAYFIGDIEIPHLGQLFDGAPYIESELLDPELQSKVYKYSRKRIFVSETLRMLVNNGYKTDEELRHEKEISSIEKQLTFTRAAVLISFVGIAISILVPNLVTTVVDIKNQKIVTELSPTTMSGTQTLINESIKPIVNELINTQNKLTEISNELHRASEKNPQAAPIASPANTAQKYKEHTEVK